MEHGIGWLNSMLFRSQAALLLNAFPGLPLFEFFALPSPKVIQWVRHQQTRQPLLLGPAEVFRD